MAPPGDHEAPGSRRQPEPRREGARELELDLGGRRGQHPPAGVHVDAGGEQVGRRPGDRSGAGHVGHEARVARERGVLEHHVAEVGDEVVVAHRLLGHVDRDGLAHDRRGSSVGDREVREALEELLVQPGDAVGERPRAAGPQSRSGRGGGASVTFGPRPAGTPRATSAFHHTSSPTASRIDSIWLTCALIALHLGLEDVGRELVVDRELLARSDRAGCPGRKTLNGSQTGRNSAAHSGVTQA